MFCDFIDIICLSCDVDDHACFSSKGQMVSVLNVYFKITGKKEKEINNFGKIKKNWIQVWCNKESKYILIQAQARSHDLTNFNYLYIDFI